MSSNMSRGRGGFSSNNNYSGNRDSRGGGGGGGFSNKRGGFSSNRGGFSNNRGRFSNNRGGNSGGRGGFNQGNRSFNRDSANTVPDSIIPIGNFSHECEGKIVIKTNVSNTLDSVVPHFNSFVFLENKTPIGKVDEIFGPINQYMFSVVLSQNTKSSSFKESIKVFIDPNRTLNMSVFLPKDNGPVVKKRAGKSDSGGFSNNRNNSRGQFNKSNFNNKSRGFGSKPFNNRNQQFRGRRN